VGEGRDVGVGSAVGVGRSVGVGSVVGVGSAVGMGTVGMSVGITITGVGICVGMEVGMPLEFEINAGVKVASGLGKSVGVPGFVEFALFSVGKLKSTVLL